MHVCVYLCVRVPVADVGLLAGLVEDSIVCGNNVSVTFRSNPLACFPGAVVTPAPARPPSSRVRTTPKKLQSASPSSPSKPLGMYLSV